MKSVNWKKKITQKTKLFPKLKSDDQYIQQRSKKRQKGLLSI